MFISTSWSQDVIIVESKHNTISFSSQYFDSNAPYKFECTSADSPQHRDKRTTKKKNNNKTITTLGHIKEVLYLKWIS